MEEQKESAEVSTAEAEESQSSEAPNSEQSSEESAPPDWSIFDESDDTERESPPESVAQEKTASEPEEKSTDDSEDEDEEELDTLNETLTDDERSQVNLPKPARRRLRALEKLEKAVLNPFKDTDTPINEAWKALSEFHPVRAQELAQTVAEQSIKAYGNDWLPVILDREGVTVEQVLSALDNKSAPPAKEAAPDTKSSSEIPSLTDQPEVQEYVKYLDDAYGDDWRDESKDGELIDDDKLAVQSLRAQMAQEEALRSQIETSRSELQAAKDEIASLKPEVDSIKETQQTEWEKRLESQVNATTKDYKSKVESRALPKVFTDMGLEPAESDTDEVKAVKQIIKSKFEPDGDYISDFEMFAQTRFSEKDNLEKVVRRVAKNIGDAEQKTLEAQTLKDKAQSDKLLTEAGRLRELAQDEQDTIAVLLNRAGKEFAKEYQPILDILAENAALKKQASKGQRQTITGAPEGGLTRADMLKRIGEAENPFEEAQKLGIKLG